MTARRIRYRFWQFFSMVLGNFRPVDIEYVKAKLSSADLFELFTRMPHMEQNHGVAVCKVLDQRGQLSPDLLTAALLHDVGKIKHFPRLWERVFTVIFNSFTPHLATEMAQASPKGFRRGVVVHQRHASWGADLVRRAGASPRTIFLIEAHHSAPRDDVELAALQAVDNG